jgi:hypothetical protein
MKTSITPPATDFLDDSSIARGRRGQKNKRSELADLTSAATGIYLEIRFSGFPSGNFLENNKAKWWDEIW